ncbi:hypothetical protein F4861DRAFT_531081 [Xylaria intraflava]|nr:hypothetical protein F4861DRAFT_531081 [Xylaria intraflava]
MRGFHQASSGISPDTSPQDVEDAQYQPQPHSPIRSHAGLLINQYQSIGYESGFTDQIVFQETKSQSSRSRKRSSPGIDHVKHRRTRSGCYTCRSRRVKCDENRPICDRCRKGKRDCSYPDSLAVKGSAGSSTSKEPVSASQEVSPEPSIEDGDDFEKEPTLESIPDEDEPIELSARQPQSPRGLLRDHTASAFNLRKTSNRQNSETPSLDGTKSSSPSVSTGTSASFTTATPQLNTNPEWAHLHKDLRYYMGYYCENITYFNYGMTNDTDGFFKSILPSLAVREGNDALLYAVVGFAAYHSMLRHPNGRIENFLEYYNKSVQILLSNLNYEHQQNLPTLLAILQLATIEEYLGDWVNLAGHQKAAMRILTQLFTPETIMRSPINELLAWYIRFDLFVATMGGFQPALPREWVVSAMEGGQERLREDPDNLSWRISMQSAVLRFISMDMSLLYAKKARDEISPEDFAREYNDILIRLAEWKTNLDPRITDSNYLVTDFQHKQPLTDDDIVNPYKPGFLYKGPLFATTILLLKWHSIKITHLSRQAGFSMHKEPSNELRQLSLSACELFETVRLWPEAPPGVTVTVQSSLAMACFFMPRDQRHNMWIRRRYAHLEAAGYISPPTMRARMAELFRDPSCNHWWLPHDEGMLPVLRSIRAYSDAREDGNPVTEQTEALREMSAIFSNMRIGNDGGPSPREQTGPNVSAGRKGKNVRGRS